MTSSTFTRAGLLLAALGGLAAGAGCGSPAGLVPNPTYQAWAAFEPGSSVTLEGTRTTGQAQQKVQIIQRLLESDANRIVLERSVQVLDANASQPPVVTRKVELAKIDPADSPRTRPEARTKDLGEENVLVKGKTYPCRVSEVQVHAEFGEPLPAVEDLRLRTWSSPDIPGGTARIDLSRRSASHNMDLVGQVVDFHAVRRHQQ
jgi:hypothetical protein